MEKTVNKTFNEYEDFEIGTIVKLKSGGPRMTINHAAGSDYECVWFVQNAIHRVTFDQGAIERVTKDPDLSPA